MSCLYFSDDAERTDSADLCSVWSGPLQSQAFLFIDSTDDRGLFHRGVLLP